MITSLRDIRPSHRTVMTIGTFDGLHRGHQALLGRTIELARSENLHSLVFAFSQPPHNYFGAKKPLLLPLARKLALLDERFDLVLSVDFPDVSWMEPEHFISEVLVRRLKVAAIVIGRDWRFGKDRKGTISMLKALGQELSFRVELVPPVLHEGRIISSTMIRELVQSGQVRLAHELMGTAPTLIGTIVQGDGRGRLLGYPTANLSVAPELVRPAEGVYAVRAHYRSTTKDGILYIGKRPTFDGKSQAIEVHLFDTSGDLYDLEMKVDLLYYLRGDQYFSDISSLQEQMRADAAKARDLLAKSVIPQERSVRYESAK